MVVGISILNPSRMDIEEGIDARQFLTPVSPPPVMGRPPARPPRLPPGPVSFTASACLAAFSFLNLLLPPRRIRVGLGSRLRRVMRQAGSRLRG